MKKTKVNDKKVNFTLLLSIIVAVSIISAGLFYEWMSCAVSVLLILWLILKASFERQISFNINFVSFSVFSVVAMYAITAFWAVDNGMAFIGFLKFLPVALFFICLCCETGAEDFIKRYTPFFAGALVIICSALMQIPALKSYFSVAGRLSGTFEYPNTFAAFVLAAELLAFSSPINKYFKAVIIAVLLFGIFYTGSRTVLILTVSSNIFMVFFRFKLSKKTAFISLAALCVVLGISLSCAFLHISPFDRLLAINFSESTFIGRILYFKDALPIILKHPFGLGYLGYFYTQTTFQTGIYSVKYIHNDIMQIALDVGWIPAVLFVGAWLKSIFSKGVSPENRIILSVLFLHLLFDFDLQFIAVFMFILVFLRRDGGKIITVKKSSFGAALISFAGAGLSLYFSVALALFSFGKTEASNSMFPYNTDNQIKMLMSMQRSEGYEVIADSIIDRNEYVYYAYGEKARAAYSKGDFLNLIKYKNLVFEYAPLNYNEYEEYCYMLINGVSLYNNAGDMSSAEICKKQLVATRGKYMENLKKVSDFGLRIKDKPPESFPDDVEEYINSVLEEK